MRQESCKVYNHILKKEVPDPFEDILIYTIFIYAIPSGMPQWTFACTAFPGEIA